MNREQATELGLEINRLAPVAAERILGGLVRQIERSVPAFGGIAVERDELPVNDFIQGGCCILAKALAEWAGPSAEVIGVWWFSNLRGVPRVRNVLDHVVVRIGPWFFDQDGAATERELLVRWAHRLYGRPGVREDRLHPWVQREKRGLVARTFVDRFDAVWLSRFTAHEERGLTCSRDRVDDAVAFLTERLGDPSEWGVTRRAFSPRARFRAGEAPKGWDAKKRRYWDAWRIRKWGP